jgi:hypothetical protein
MTNRTTPQQITFVHEGMTVEVYGPADDRGRMPYLGRIDLFGRVFVSESTRRTVALTDAHLADEDTMRRIIAAAV